MKQQSLTPYHWAKLSWVVWLRFGNFCVTPVENRSISADMYPCSILETNVYWDQACYWLEEIDKDKIIRPVDVHATKSSVLSAYFLLLPVYQLKMSARAQFYPPLWFTFWASLWMPILLDSQWMLIEVFRGFFQETLFQSEGPNGRDDFPVSAWLLCTSEGLHVKVPHKHPDQWKFFILTMLKSVIKILWFASVLHTNNIDLLAIVKL